MMVRFRAAAARDLDEIFDYSVAHHGPASAEGYLRGLYAAMDRLPAYPELGAETGLRPKLRVVSVREHRVFYRVEARSMVIVRVLHKAMDAARHL